MVPVDKLTDFLIIDAKTMIAHMLCRSAIVGPNNPATSAILVFTMSRSPPPNAQRHELEGRIVERRPDRMSRKPHISKCRQQRDV